MPTSAWRWIRRRWPELGLAALALAVFLAFLGSMELWGKREQRSAAETIDTIQEGHWLVARIQGRPRLEKPPLPRWTIAALMTLTGRQDEWVVRLPGALSAVGMVALVYALGLRLGGRALGLTAGLVLCTFPFFIAEMRQAGNDGPLAFFTTLAIYAAYRRLNRDDAADPTAEPVLGSSRWLLLMYLALGLGFLTKGPIVAIVAALTLFPYLSLTGRFWPGLRALWSARGLLLFTLLALSWPVPVMLSDPQAVRVWMLEMGQKAGTAGVEHHRDREILALQWFGMAAPWCILGLPALFWPLARRRTAPPGGWLPWSWAALNLLMFCFWRVAKPNYYLPCMPGAALLIGAMWLHVARVARGTDRAARLARPMLQGHWVTLFVLAAVSPLVVRQFLPAHFTVSVVLAAAIAVCIVASTAFWRRGLDAASMTPFAVAMLLIVLVSYGRIVPSENPGRSHRSLAVALDRVLPDEARTVLFYHELDEGLWFYLRDRALKPIPGSTPRYNDGFDMLEQFRNKQLLTDPNARLNEYRQKLLNWIASGERESPYVLIRASRFDAVASDLAGHVEVLLREHDVKRNGLLLFRVVDPAIRQAEAVPSPSRL